MDLLHASNQIEILMNNQDFIQQNNENFIQNPRLLRSLRASRTRLLNRGLIDIWIEYSLHEGGNIEIQQCVQIMTNIGTNILNSIQQYHLNPNENALHRIAVSITAWGGGSGFRNSLANNGFLNPDQLNQNMVIYLNFINGIQNFNQHQEQENFNFLLTQANLLHGLGVSFGTKHCKFWSNNELPIWDTRISTYYFLCKPKWGNYIEYKDFLEEQSILYGLTVNQLEHLMFNYLDYLDLN